MKMGNRTLKVRIEIVVTWATVFRMRLMGRYPAAIIARAIADRIRQEVR